MREQVRKLETRWMVGAVRIPLLQTLVFTSVLYLVFPRYASTKFVFSRFCQNATKSEVYLVEFAKSFYVTRPPWHLEEIVRSYGYINRKYQRLEKRPKQTNSGCPHSGRRLLWLLRGLPAGADR